METKEKKQAADAIKKASNILVTVGVDPTVDELSALLGLTLVLGKLDKHATAVFSGRIPQAISFLEPDKTFEDTVDGLRDFIIALNKDKADHLRYKLDGDVVKIFITPYKNTIIRDTDLEFSQGDFNVELILALGVENKADLDSAVSAHGRILHDSTTVTLTAGETPSDLGEIDWHASSASSLCEMIYSLIRDLGDSLLDEHVATALLTGIVSNTERFSNNLTTSDVMKTAASLMAAGANQQLIAARLQPEPVAKAPEPAAEPELKPVSEAEDDDEDTSESDSDGTMNITHDQPADEPLPDGPSLVDIERDKDQVLQEALDKVIPAASVDLNDLRRASDEPLDEPESTPPLEPRHFIAKANGYDQLDEPSMGGTLNATTEQAEEESRAAIQDDRNHVILSHDAPAAAQPDPFVPKQPAEAPVEPPAPQEAPEEPSTLPAPEPQPSVDDALATLGYPAGSHPTLADLDQKTGRAPVDPPAGSLEVDDARAAVGAALDSAFNPANNPLANVGSQPLGEELHAAPAPFVSPPIVSPITITTPVPNEPAVIAAAPLAPPVAAPLTTPVAAPLPVPAPLELPPLPPLPPLPGQPGELPALPPLPDISEIDTHDTVASTSTPSTITTPSPDDDDWQLHTVEPPANDPNQFHIPGQK